MNIGEAIVCIRKAKHITQKNLAEKIGISPNALCSIEKNSSFPTKDTISKICKALNIPPSYLLFLSISKEDIPSDKIDIFNVLSEPLKKILLDA